MAGVVGISGNRLELLQIADAVAREKTIDRKIVIQAMEDAIQKAAKSRYGAENDIRCEIDPKTGETRLSRVLAVVDEVENEATQITVDDAKRRNHAGQHHGAVEPADQRGRRRVGQGGVGAPGCGNHQRGPYSARNCNAGCLAEGAHHGLQATGHTQRGTRHTAHNSAVVG